VSIASAESSWTRLRDQPHGDGELEIPGISAGINTGFGEIWYAISPTGNARFLVPIGSASLPKSMPRPLRLRIHTARLRVRGSWARFVDVECLETGLLPVFAELSDVVIERVRNGNSPISAVASAISDFRNLLQEETSTLDSEELLGLLGELLVLERVGQFLPNAEDSWVGPFQDRHDFRFGVHALETKTSARRDATSVTIHGLEQLTPPNGGTLVLAHVCLERSSKGTECLESIYRRLVDSGMDSGKLLSGLSQLGISDPFFPALNVQSYNFEQLTTYKVEAEFPRLSNDILHGRLPAGVSGIRYQIDLGTASRYKMDERSFEKHLMECVR